MSNFFFKASDYSLFQKAFKDASGEDVVVDVLSTDDSLKEQEVVVQKHVIRKDNRFNQESSFNKFFGPRRSMNRNVDMKDFSSWKNKNYRETEKQIGGGIGEKPRFSFADFMNERSRGKTYNDADSNRESGQKAINEMSSEDPLYKRFSLNDYMRRLEEKTRVNSETRDNEDLIETIGESTQEVVPDSHQDENFDEHTSNINVESFVEDESFKGENFSVEKSELDEMKSRLDKIKAQTEEINKLVDEDEKSEEEVEEFNFETFDDEDSEEIDDDDLDEENDEEELAENDEESEEEIESEEKSDKVDSTQDEKVQDGSEKAQDKTDSDENQVMVVVQTGDKAKEEQNQEEGVSKTTAEISETEKLEKTPDTNKSEEILKLIDKNEKERKEIEDKLKQAEQDKIDAMKRYETRLKELEKSIKEKDREAQKRVLLEKVKNDNRLSEVRAEYESREAEIRRLEKESALKLKIGALLKKELKNNLSISNLEMNNKLLETTSLINQEKEREKANKTKKTTTRKRKSKRRIDSDIIGNFDFD